MYKVVKTKQADKDYEKLKSAGLLPKGLKLLKIIKADPYKTPPRFEKMTGDLDGYYSRRINRQHRLVYDVLPNTENLLNENGVPYKGIVKVLRMWTPPKKLYPQFQCLKFSAHKAYDPCSSIAKVAANASPITHISGTTPTPSCHVLSVLRISS